MSGRPFFTVCIPAYNRAHLLLPLLESIESQDFDDCEILVCEDASRERAEIAKVCEAFRLRSRVPLRLEENASNLGYDGNIRALVRNARGEFCFFMGNDDLMAPGAMRIAASALTRHAGAGFLLRGYAWFDHEPDHAADTVRYVAEETVLPAGRAALGMCYRRAGIISGYIVQRDPAFAAETDRFDGSLYYQLHLTAAVLARQSAVVIPDVLVYCRNSEPPEFGDAPSEQGLYTPGRYTPEARVNLVKGAMRILEGHPELDADGTRHAVLRDYARHFYPFVRDQLHLPPRAYLALCRAYARMPIGRYPSFYVNCIVSYLLGQRLTDGLLHWVRARLGRTPRLS